MALNSCVNAVDMRHGVIFDFKTSLFPPENTAYNRKIISYQSACLIVVQVDCGARVMPIFQRVHKLFGDLLSKCCVITAASPNPSSATWGLRIHTVIHFE